MSKRTSYIFVILFLATTTVLLFSAVQLSYIKLEISQFFLVVASITFFSTLSAIQGFIRISENETTIIFDDFDEILVTKSINSVMSRIPHEPNYFKNSKELPSWEVKSDDFVGKDNSLALAKLRIDLERELRKIADYSQLDLDVSRMNILKMTEELISNKIIPSEWSYTLRDVIQACNRAIHGAEISDEMTFKFIAAGSDLIKGLSLISQTIEANPSWKYDEFKSVDKLIP